MLFKAIVICTLISCVLGGGKLSPPALDCAFDVTLQPNDSDKVMKRYGFQHEDTFIILAESYKPDDLPTKDYMLFRSDIKNKDNDILFEGYGGPNPEKPKYCQLEYVDKSAAAEEIRFLTAKFQYAGDAKTVSCPVAGASDCKQYCNDNSECVIVDGKGRYVQLVDGTTVTYANTVHKDDEFMINCDNGTKLPAPANPCRGAPSSSTASSLKSALVAVVLAALVAAML